MNIRTRYALLTACLVGAMVASVTATVASVQRSALEQDASNRLELLLSSAGRIAQEAHAAHDELMALSYLMFLQRTHAELSLAEIESGGRTSRLGSDGQELVHLSREFPAKNVREAGRGAAIRVRLGFRRDLLDKELERALRPLLLRTLAIGAAFLALGVLASAALARMMAAPLRELAAAAEAVGAGNLRVRVREGGGDELGALARRFNEMTGRIRELMEFKEDILHTLTHELNTPLGGVAGHLELWAEDGPPERRESFLETSRMMHAAVVRMQESLGSALRLFRSQAVEEKAAPSGVVWVDQIVADVRRLLEPSATAKGVTVHPLPKGEVGFAYVPELPLRQLITNLMSNAVKYTQSGGEVRLSLREGAAALELKVADTGEGVPAEDIPHLFTKFYRAGNGAARSERIPGTGLGLSIAKRIATDALGGDLLVESELGKGSTFIVRIPKMGPLSSRARRRA